MISDTQQQMKKFSIVDLQRELKEYQEENKDLYKNLSLNLDVQNLAMFQQGSIKQLSDEQKEALIQNFSKENQQLKQLIEKMTQDRNVAQSKSILIEQQTEENENFKKMMRYELEERIKEIRKILVEKESVIQQIEIDKNSLQNAGQKESDPQLNDTNQMSVHKDVLTASVPLFRIHEETEQLKKEIVKSVQQIETLNQKNKKCRQNTKLIRFQIEQLKNALLSSNIKKKKCITEQQNIFSDDEDYNCAHLSKKVSQFENEKLKMKLLAEKANFIKQNKMKNENIQYGLGTQRNQKISQMETDIEKYKNLTQIWLDQNKRKVSQLKKLQRYNQTLEKSNEQLIENYHKLQQKISSMTQNLKQYKDSYYQIMNRKKMRNHNSNISSLMNSTNTQQTAYSNQNSIGQSDFLSPKSQVKQVGFEELVKKNEEKDLISVEEEEIDEDISQRRTLSQYQSIGQKNNELQKKLSQFNNGDFYYDEYYDKKPFPPMQRKKQSISHLYKIKQQLGQLKKQYHFSLNIMPQDPNYVNTNLIPKQQIKIARSLSDCVLDTQQNEKCVLWSLEKRKVSHFFQQDPFLFSPENSGGGEEDGDICNSMNRNDEKNRKRPSTQLVHNNSFFRELDISMIFHEKKNKK
ncbi:hypothetical protein TTHERM_00528450 (macronuclear) [Tetrahymena thermophila SB210]|uniref:Uncharacterized protein n=1 Tax=Tetrahymena thermophila (strain SB210) TaxID=312017 RepID=I7MN48_TETTS|nr:hypothetical protein TTHERM_00528450 [Tetrahymena thermophila SB210]EAS07909.2 hypothetical protein TTHERM_00528450 [Tetrahymena thermophila SB210]|eukprot:XP_001028151.2 hypothetical protein TTHERM_00528450 [Tetrahymena thermophila SB210]